MENINLFNAIATLKALAVDNEAIKATLEVLEKELKSVTAQYTISTGLEAARQAQQARQEVVDFLHYTEAKGVWKESVVTSTIVDGWKGFLAGNLPDGTIITLDDDRIGNPANTKVNIRFYDYGIGTKRITVLLF